jgi:hypothetical protein
VFSAYLHCVNFGREALEELIEAMPVFDKSAKEGSDSDDEDSDSDDQSEPRHQTPTKENPVSQ